MVLKFIWDEKRPCVKLYRDKSEGGLSLPNLKHYFLSFVLRPLSDWLNPTSTACWKAVESDLVSPHRLEDFIYSNVPFKRAKLRFGPIVSFLLLTWHLAIKEAKVGTKWHLNSPLFNNYSLLTGGVPFSSLAWSTKGVHTLADVLNDSGFLILMI